MSGEWLWEAAARAEARLRSIPPEELGPAGRLLVTGSREAAKRRHPSASSPLTTPEHLADSSPCPSSPAGTPPGRERTDETTTGPETADCGGGAKPPRGSSVSSGGRPADEPPEDEDLDLVRWVARLGCGHDTGSRGRVRVSAIPAVGAVLVCKVCREETKVEDVIDSRPLG